MNILNMAILGLSLVASNCFSDSLKIGTSGPYSGDLATLGEATYRASKLVFDKVNEDGGVLGKTIEIVKKDDECSGDVSPGVANAFVDEKVPFVIGHNCSGASLAALPIYNKAGILAVSSSATNPELTKSGKFPLFFRTVSSDDLHGSVEVAFAKKMGFKSIAIIHDDDPYGQGLAKYVEKAAADLGINILAKTEIQRGKDDYSEVVEKTSKVAADAIIFGGVHPEAAKLIVELRTKGHKTPFISANGITNKEYIKLAGEHAEGTYASESRDNTGRPEAKAAIKQYVDAYGEEPGEFYLEAYAAAVSLINALVKSNSEDSAKVASSLRSEKVTTTIGDVQFDKSGDLIGGGLTMYQVKDGKWVVIQ